jgi:Bacterial regulatory helix-turn-helix protein, lysR family
MTVFRQVAELGSFVEAAERLNLSTAMTSEHLKFLEKHWGSVLRTRSVAPPPAHNGWTVTCQLQAPKVSHHGSVKFRFVSCPQSHPEDEVNPDGSILWNQIPIRIGMVVLRMRASFRRSAVL